MRLAFMGTPDFAVPALDALLAAGHDIAAVYSQPPRPAGRGKALTPSPVHRRAEQVGLAVRTPLSLRDVDGLEDERAGTISVFEGPMPIVSVYPDEQAEADAVRSFVQEALGDGIEPGEIGIFVRLPELVARANAAIAPVTGAELVKVANMHLAKGLEFRAVAVMACDEGVLPCDSRVADAADEAELDDIYETERRLLYVACTRARERLLITGTMPGSEYLADL